MPAEDPPPIELLHNSSAPERADNATAWLQYARSQGAGIYVLQALEAVERRYILLAAQAEAEAERRTEARLRRAL